LALVWALLMAVSSLILMDVGSEVREGLGRGRRGARALLSRLELARGHFFYFLFLSPSFFSLLPPFSSARCFIPIPVDGG